MNKRVKLDHFLLAQKHKKSFALKSTCLDWRDVHGSQFSMFARLQAKCQPGLSCFKMAASDEGEKYRKKKYNFIVIEFIGEFLDQLRATQLILLCFSVSLCGTTERNP